MTPKRDHLLLDRRTLFAATGALSLATMPIARGLETAHAATVQQEGGSTLRFVWLGDIDPLWHPASYHTFGQAVIFSLIFNNLVKLDEDLVTVIPDLAESWEISDDATQFTFNLRQDVKWHDGESFSANDVVFSFSRQIVEPYQFAKFMDVLEGAEAYKDGTAETVSGLEAIDDHTVRMTLTEPNSLFLLNLAEPGTVIVPQHLLEDIAPDTIESATFVTDSPVGTGPYTFVEWATDQYVQLAANPDYFKGAPAIDQLFMVRLRPEVTVAQLESGEIDLALRLNPTEKERLDNIASLQVIAQPGVGLTGLAFPTEEERMSDKRIRQAVYYAIDREGIVNAVFQGQAQVLNGAPPAMDHFDGLNPYTYDPDKARALLEEAGYDSSAKFRIIYDQNYPGAPQYYPLIGQQLEQVGFNVELNALDTSAYTDRLLNQRDTWEAAGFAGGAWGMGPWATADYYDCQDPFRTGYTNCEVDQLFDDARTVVDPEERDAYYRDAALILNEDLPRIPLWTPYDLHAATTRLGGGFSVYRDPRRSFTDVETWTLEPA